MDFDMDSVRFHFLKNVQSIQIARVFYLSPFQSFGSGGRTVPIAFSA
jgi:hypothetical protein